MLLPCVMSMVNPYLRSKLKAGPFNGAPSVLAIPQLTILVLTLERVAKLEEMVMVMVKRILVWFLILLFGLPVMISVFQSLRNPRNPFLILPICMVYLVSSSC